MNWCGCDLSIATDVGLNFIYCLFAYLIIPTFFAAIIFKLILFTLKLMQRRRKKEEEKLKWI